MGRFATFLVGGLVGAGIALLTTPRTGEENRALINDTLNENYPDAMKAARATTNQLVDAAELLRPRSSTPWSTKVLK